MRQMGRLADHPNLKRSELIDEASREFDLTPLEADFLYRHIEDLQQSEPPRASHS
jgi:hypothetical protein